MSWGRASVFIAFIFVPAIQLCIYGACGRMGQALIRAADADERVEIRALIDRADHPLQGQTICADVRLGADIAAVLDSCACIIDFSAAPASQALVETLLASRCANLPAVVIGTTGHEPSFANNLHQLTQKTAAVHAPNMSIGVNLCYHLAAEAARIAGRAADIEITEAHHSRKTDAPSGTALELGKVICRQLGLPFEGSAVYARHGQTGARQPGSIGYSVIRAGDIVGDHKVLFALDNELIEIRHSALNRENFAGGALAAAAWLIRAQAPDTPARRSPGLYSMSDVLGLTKAQPGSD